jgi:hypothetical protein
MVTINGVDCYGKVDVDESVATNFTQLVKYLEKILPDCEILEIECG